MTEPHTTLRVRVQPRAGRDEIAGERAGALLVRVTAPPADGRANAAVCRLLAERAGVPRTSVSVVRGQTSRDKLLRFDGLTAEHLQRRLGAA